MMRNFIREPLEAYGKKTFSEEEYLVWEDQQTEKHEFYSGEIFAIARPGAKHSVITSNTLRALSNRLKGKGCKPYGSDLRVHIPNYSIYTYPDISVVCQDMLTVN